MNQAIEAYHSVAVSREFKELERLRSKAGHDEAQALHNAEQKGLREGERKGILNVARNLLEMGSSIDNIMTATGLTRKEIEKLRGPTLTGMNTRQSPA